MKSVMLFFHFLGLVMSLGSIITILMLLKTSSKAISSESESLVANIHRILRLTFIGLGVMFLTGGYLMTPYWSAFTLMPLLHIKFTVFIFWCVTLVALSVYTKTAKHNRFKLYYPRIVFLSFSSLIFGLTALAMASIQFQ